MIRVLQLFPSQADYQTRKAIEQLRAGVGMGFSITARSIGRGGDHGGTVQAILRLRREAGAFDLVHAWGTAALTAAAFGAARHVVFTPTVFPSRRQIRWLRAVMGQRDVNVICTTSTMRRAMVERGVELERCHLVRPGVDFARVKRRRDATLRTSLGIRENDKVLLAVGESTRDAAHEHAAWAASIVNCLDQQTRLLILGRGPLAEKIVRFGKNLGQEELVIHAQKRLARPIEFEELLPASDMIILPPTGPVPTLPICTTMAAGLPIVATVTPTVAELLEDRHTALMTQGGVPRLVSEKILQLREDPQLQWSISDMAKTEAFEYFALTRFLEQYRGVYRQASAGMKVEVAETAPGAGMRFHGRA